MRVLQIRHQREFTDEMDELRKSCFPGRNVPETSRDPFDDRSTHAVLTLEGVLVAMGRLTHGPGAVFKSWSHGKADIPDRPDTVDLGRVAVSPEFRGLDLSRLLMSHILPRCRERGFAAVNGAVRPGRRMTDLLRELGFVESGPQVSVDEPNGNAVIIQPMVASLVPGVVDRNRAIFAEQVAALVERGFTVVVAADSMPD